MERLWKQLLHLDAKLLCFGSVALFLAVLGLVSWLYLHRSVPPPAPPLAETSSQISSNDIGVLRFVASQLAPQALIIPANPFRPSIEYMHLNLPTGTTNALLMPPPPPITNSIISKQPTKTNRVTGATNKAPPGTPTYTFRGYFQRPDGTPAALFHSALDNTSRFFLPGSNIQSAILLSADIKTADVQQPDGKIVHLALGEAFTLPTEKP
jgi:hypothetical protein